MAAILRFSATFSIDARNGAAYAGAVTYQAGHTYHFKMRVNPAAHTFSATARDL